MDIGKTVNASRPKPAARVDKAHAYEEAAAETGSQFRILKEKNDDE
jgi:hypothetical protein